MQKIRSPPYLVFLEKHGHYPYKNKIAKNAGDKNVRDGLYTERYFIGMFDPNAILSRVNFWKP